MDILLIATYEMGRQPFGLASPKAWLERDGHRVRCVDLALEKLGDDAIRAAELIGFHLPMHTATRLAVPVIERVRRIHPGARIVCYGLYAPLNAELLRSLGVEAIAGGEFEPALVAIARGGQVPEVSIGRQEFLTPDRSDLPPAGKYALLRIGEESKPVAYTEASRGCKHRCRHCPVVPVYQGQFRVVQREVVLEDIRRQVSAGARHVTFGDPDFLNGPTHATRIVEALHAEFPSVTYDATIKIEHLLKHRDLLTVLRDTGCILVTSAVESFDDRVLARLEKHHTRRDFLEAVALARAAGLNLQPTFIAFTPWTTVESYRDFLNVIAEQDLVENVPSVQLALRLLITSGSRLLELDDIRERIGPFDSKSLVYPWTHRDPEVDQLGQQVFRIVSQERPRAAIFRKIWEIANNQRPPENFDLIPRAAIPYLDEPWYC